MPGTRHTSRGRRSSTRGARGANAGDDYHELWALREALSLLDPNSGLTAITLEGLHPDDEVTAPPEAWDGVDCAYYFGGEDLASADRAAFDQVKYSTADPDSRWTVARLTHARRGTRASSVIGRLGLAFVGYEAQRPDLVLDGRLRIRLVSNQPIADEVLDALRTPTSGTAAATKDRGRLATASTVPPNLGDAFFRALDFSECGAGSRFAMEARLARTLSAWSHPDALGALDTLRRRVRELMMPEAAGAVLTRREVLSWFGFVGERALFPCPAALRAPSQVVPRPVTSDLLALLRTGEQRVCVRGGGGVGKTTALLDLSTGLPVGSVMIVFDCYGAGRYLDAESPRHRPADAYLQMANEMAARLKLPPLLHRDPDISIFVERLRQAAEALAASDPDAWLVLVIDAADNAVHAAQVAAPAEPAFLHPLARVGQFPPNVRLIISTRTSRLSSLNLDSRFKLLEVPPFSPAETATFIRLRWREAPDDNVEDFHALSGGNPRVLSYAIGVAGNEPARALEALRPSGKALDQVFDEQLREAVRRAGLTEQDAKRMAQGLMALPRAVPLLHLSPVVGRSEAHLREFATDLAPGLRLVEDAVGFADEDFEEFVRNLAGGLAPVRDLVADQLIATQESDVYAAVHIAPALLAAGRRGALLDLVRREGPPPVIQDPVLRREVQLQRMRIAIRVCRESGDVADALLTNLRGAAALKTDTAIRYALRRFPDLAVRFADRSVAQMFLQEPGDVEHHGVFLFNRLAADAERGDNVSVREGERWLRAWLHHRKSALAAAKNTQQLAGAWNIDDEDIAAEAIGFLRTVGARKAWRHLRRWRPPSVRYRALLLAAPLLVAADQAHLIEETLTELGLVSLEPILRVPLARRDGTFDAVRVQRALRLMHRRGLVGPDRQDTRWELPASLVAYEECVLTACEWCVAAGSRSNTLSEILSLYGGPFVTGGVRERPARIDLRLRALAMLARLGGQRLQVSALMRPKPHLSEEATLEERKNLARWEEEHQEWQDLAGPLVSLYDARAQCLLSVVPPTEHDSLLRRALDDLEKDSYRLGQRYGGLELRALAASALLSLLGRPGTDPAILWHYANAVAASRPSTFGPREVERWTIAAACPQLHPALVEQAAAIASDVQQAQISAREQVDALCLISRALLPISASDAAAIFLKALDAAAGIDETAMHLVPLISSVAVASASSLDAGTRRQVARDTAIIVEDAATRLAGYDDFPWRSAAEALAAWDAPFALAAVARWDDERVVSRNDFLPPILLSALEAERVTPTAALALLPLLERSPHPDLLEAIVTRTMALGDAVRSAMAERVAADELLNGGEGVGSHGSAVLSLAGRLRPGPTPGPWEAELATHVAFHAARVTEYEDGTSLGGAHRRASAGQMAKDVIQQYPWESCDLTRPTALSAAVRALEHSPPYVPASAVYAHIQTLVPLRDRVRYLDTLMVIMREPAQPSSDAADALREALIAWQGQPAIDAWLVGPMLQQLPDVLPYFLYWPREANALQFVCRRIAAVDASLRDQVCDALLHGLELHVEELSAADIYWMVGLAAEFVDAVTLSRVATGLTDQLLTSVPGEHRATWNVDDLPADPTVALGRALFAFLGDMDSRVRWRAAHVLRRLAAFDEAELLDAVVAQYSRREESVFRDPDAPFYWQAARLWLVIALCRIGHERAQDIAPYAAFLTAVGTDSAFPHLLLRDFAARAVRALHDAGIGEVPAGDLAALADALGANSPRSRRRESWPLHTFGREEQPELRFHFDGIDTVPYWYQQAAAIFSDVSMPTFLTHADHWIIDRWGASPTASHWVEEPRRHRLDDHRWGEWSHRHGGRPLLDRLSTHLEWHAMWCVAGELLGKHALRGPDRQRDDYHTLEGWLRREGLSNPPIWLADLCTPRPMYQTRDLSSVPAGWEEAVHESDFLAEVGLTSDAPTLVLRASWEHDERPAHVSVSVRAAFVTPSRAFPLLRALQTVESSHDFVLPDVGDDAEIHSGGHQLLGVFLWRERDGSLDDHDPLCRGGRGIPVELPSSVAAALGLRFALYPHPGWEEAKTGALLLRYECWSRRDQQSRYQSEHDGGSGWRLHVDRSLLARMMARRKLDVLLSVSIERRLQRYSSDVSDSENEGPSAYHSRLYLLRRSGELVTADGPAGTWAAPRP